MSVQPYRNDLIKGAMAEKDMSRDRLKEITGLSLPTISSIRNGATNITLDNLIKVTAALELEMFEIFTPKKTTEESALVGTGV